MKKPNIVVVITHDTGRFIGPYDRGVMTPHLEKIALDGFVFDQAFTTAPQCSPSRASFLTGLYPHEHGLIGLTHLGFSLNQRGLSRTLPRILNDAGYQTYLFGFQHEAWHSKDLGYQHIVKTTQAPKDFARFVTPNVVSFLQSKPQQPFYVMVGFEETHRPYDQVDTPLDDIRVPSYLPDNAIFRRDMANLFEQVRRVDQSVGMIYRTLQEQQLLDDTLFVFTTDHGISAFGAKGTLRDPGIEIALVMRGYMFRGGMRTKELVSNIDFYTTILELCGVSIPQGTQGKSLIPLAYHPHQPIRDKIFSELSYHVIYDPQRGVRTKTRKYIRSYEKRPFHPPADVDPSAVKDWLKGRGAFEMQRDPEMLFDITRDPNEEHNLIMVPAYQKDGMNMKEDLQNWMKSTDDPMVSGRIAPPEGAVVQPEDSYAPLGDHHTQLPKDKKS